MNKTVFVAVTSEAVAPGTNQGKSGHPRFSRRAAIAAPAPALIRLAQLVVPPDSTRLLLPIAFLGVASLAGSYHGSFSVLLSAAVSVLAGFATLKSPHMAIVAGLLLYELPANATGENGLLYRLNEPACAFLMVLSALVHASRSKASGYLWQPIALFGILIVGIVAQDLRSAHYNDPVFICAAIALTGFSTIRTREQLNEVVFSLWLLGVTLAIVSLKSAFRDQASVVLDADSTSHYRVEGRDPNYYSFVSGMAVACALGAFAEKGLATPRLRLLRWVMLGSALVVTMGLGIQGSRSAATGMLVSAVLFVFAMRQRLSTMFVFALLVAAVTYVLAFTPLGSGWITRFSEDNLATGNGRTYIWLAAIEVFLQSSYNVVFGYGSQGSGVMLGLHEGATTCSTHNMYLALLLDSGFVGIILMAIFLGKMVWRMLFRNCVAPRLGLILLAYCLCQAIFLEAQLIPAFWWVVCVVAAAAQPRLDSTYPT